MGTARIFRASLLFACLIGAPPVAAQTLTAASWDDYTDRFGIIHSEKVEHPNRDPKTDNGLLYTAEACAIMQMRNVSYDRNRIAAGIKADEVKPGLYRRSPLKLDQLEAHDDYVGLGALAGLCGFRDVARDILAYGRGADQHGLTPADANEHFGSMADDLMKCKAVPYNYNNVTPGLWNWNTWLGRQPEIVTHLKIAAGERPTSEELALWAAILILSGNADASKRDTWLQDWLMVLTYQMSAFHSATADYAVREWWKKLHATFPRGGVKELMTAYLGDHAKGNPLAEFIDDFEQSRNPNAIMVDSISEPENLVRSLEEILSNNCGPTDLRACVDYRNFSPVNLATKLDKANQLAISGIQKDIALQKRSFDAQAAVLKLDLEFSEKFIKSFTEAEERHAVLHRQVADAVSQKANNIAKWIDKTQPPGMCAPSLCKTALLCPPMPMPCAVANNPEFKKVFGEFSEQISRSEKALQDHANQLEQLRPPVEKARQSVVEKARELDALRDKSKVVLDRLQGELIKANGFAQAAKGFVHAVAKGLIPCADVLDSGSIHAYPDACHATCLGGSDRPA
jgi:hypothetical protein